MDSNLIVKRKFQFFAIKRSKYSSILWEELSYKSFQKELLYLRNNFMKTPPISN